MQQDDKMREGEDPMEVDRDLAADSAIALLFSDEGIEQLLATAEGSSDPTTVAAKAVITTMAQVRSQFKQNGVPLRDEVFMGNEGAIAEVLLHVFKLFEKELGVQFSDDDYSRAMDMMTEDAYKILEQEAQQGGMPQDQQMAMPQQGPPQGVAQAVGAMR